MATKVETDTPFDRVYRWRTGGRERFHGRRCRILATGTSMLSALVEFEDGEHIVTSIRALRKAKPSEK